MSKGMDIKHKESGNNGMFFIGEEQKLLAEMTYTMPSRDKMIIEHTEVDDALRGKNVGLQLVRTAVEYARNNNIKIIPVCPFARSVLRKRKEFHDVLYL